MKARAWAVWSSAWRSRWRSAASCARRVRRRQTARSSATSRPASCPPASRGSGVYYNPVYGYLHIDRAGRQHRRPLEAHRREPLGRAQRHRRGQRAALHVERAQVRRRRPQRRTRRAPASSSTRWARDVGELDGQYALEDSDSVGEWHCVKQISMKPDLNSINGDNPSDSAGTSATSGSSDARRRRARPARRSRPIPAIVGPARGAAPLGVRAGSPMLVVRAVRWWRDLARLGVDAAALRRARPRAALRGAPRAHRAGAAAGRRRRASRASRSSAELARRRTATLVAEIAESQAASARPAACGSATISSSWSSRALLASLVQRRRGAARRGPTTLPLDPELVRDLDPQLPRALRRRVPRTTSAQVLEALARDHLHVLTLADALDLDTLRLLGMLGPESAAAGALAHVDLLAALSSPAANDIVNFSLELLPSVLETRRAHAAGTHAVHGYAGVGREGSIDSMVLTELAWDDEELARRMVDGELLYLHARAGPGRGAAPALHRHRRVGVDARRARGLRARPRHRARQEAPARRRGGVDALLRLAPLRRAARARPRAAAGGVAPRLQGRARAQPGARLRAARDRDRAPPRRATSATRWSTSSRTPRSTCPRPLVQEVRRQAHLFGVFILPSGGALDLEWLDLLEGYAVVDHATFEQGAARARAATKIVTDASGRG